MQESVTMKNGNIHGAGLGLRRTLMGPLTEQPATQVGFYEVAPENWIGVGGARGREFQRFTEQHRMIAHGLSLSIGSPAPLDEAFLLRLKRFIRQHDIHIYSEHLSYCSDGGHLYDLLPIPFTEEAVHYVARRIRQVQDVLEQPVAMENVSYYAAAAQDMSELEFVKAVLDEADCQMLLDVNNIYVNSINHNYDADAFLASLPAERIAYIHIAGHHQEDEDLIIDTHGADVIEDVWSLLALAYEQHGVLPTLLERDFKIPPLGELLIEVDRIIDMQFCHADRELQPGKHG